VVVVVVVMVVMVLVVVVLAVAILDLLGFLLWNFYSEIQTSPLFEEETPFPNT
jgi:hypothetical protein